MELRESCRRGLGRIVGAKQVKDTTRKWPTESKTRAHRDSESELTMREPAWSNVSPLRMLQLCNCVSVGFLTEGMEAVSDAFAWNNRVTGWQE